MKILLLSCVREQIWLTTAPPQSGPAPELQLFLCMEYKCLCLCWEGPETTLCGRKRVWWRFTTAVAQQMLGSICYAMAAITLRMPQPAKTFSQGFAYWKPCARNTPSKKSHSGIRSRKFFLKKMKPEVLKQLVPESRAGNVMWTIVFHSRCILTNRKN